MSRSAKTSKKSPESLTEKAREIWLAGLGVFSTVEEEGEKLFLRFVERGRELEAKGETLEKRARDTVESLTAYVSERGSQLSSEVSAKLNVSLPAFLEEKFQAVLETVGVSSGSDVKELSDKVDQLLDTVSKLSEQLESSGKPGAPGTKA